MIWLETDLILPSASFFFYPSPGDVIGCGWFFYLRSPVRRWPCTPSCLRRSAGRWPCCSGGSMMWRIYSPGVLITGRAAVNGASVAGLVLLWCLRGGTCVSGHSAVQPAWFVGFFLYILLAVNCLQFVCLSTCPSWMVFLLASLSCCSSWHYRQPASLPDAQLLGLRYLSV